MTMVIEALASSARSRFGALAWRAAARHAAEARQGGRDRDAALWMKVAFLVADVSDA